MANGPDDARAPNDEGVGKATERRRAEAQSRDRSLALRFKNGQCGAYDEIYKLHSPRVHRICRHMLGDPDDAAEAAQEVFLRVYQGLPKFNGRYQLGAWIGRIATNVCLDRLRSRTRKPVDAVPDEVIELCGEPSPGSEQPEEAFLAHTESDEVWRTLEELPRLHGDAIRLRDYEGYSYAEIARKLELSDVQVKALLHRARNGFRKSWISGLGVFLPWRLVQRSIAKFRTVQASAESGIQTAAASTPSVVNGCAVLLQQCGQVLGERVASLATAATIGVAAVGVGVAPQPPTTPVEEPRLEQVSTEVADSSARRSGKAAKTKSSEVVSEPSAQPEPSPSSTAGGKAPQPAPAPTTAPAPAPSPSPSTTAPKESGGPRKATPYSDPVLAFDDGQAFAPNTPVKNDVRVSCSYLRIGQSMETVISDGDGNHRALLQLDVGASVGLQLTVWKNGHEIRYTGGGSITRNNRSGSEVQLGFNGSYGTGNDRAIGAGLPQSGTFAGTLTVDCDALNVVTESVVFST